MLCKYFRTPFYFLGPIIKMSKYVPLTPYFYVMPNDLDTFWCCLLNKLHQNPSDIDPLEKYWYIFLCIYLFCNNKNIFGIPSPQSGPKSTFLILIFKPFPNGVGLFKDMMELWQHCCNCDGVWNCMSIGIRSFLD